MHLRYIDNSREVCDVTFVSKLKYLTLDCRFHTGEEQPNCGLCRSLYYLRMTSSFAAVKFTA